MSKRAKALRRGLADAVEIDTTGEEQAPIELARSRVYRQVPGRVRRRLDGVLLSRGCDRHSVSEVARAFRLRERYGITPAALEQYARKLEAVARPFLSSRLTTAILGCLPDSFRQQVVVGGQVLLLSRVVRALTDRPDEPLPAADLVKLASALRALAQVPRDARRSVRRSGGRRGDDADADASDGMSGATAELDRAIRQVYGLAWPTSGEASQDGWAASEESKAGRGPARDPDGGGRLVADAAQAGASRSQPKKVKSYAT